MTEACYTNSSDHWGLDILEAVSVDVVIHGQQIMQGMLMVRYLKQPVILGWDFLMGNSAIQRDPAFKKVNFGF